MKKKRKQITGKNLWVDDDPSYDERIVSFIKQPTYLPIIVTAAFYMLITSYYVYYFKSLSMPFFTLNLPLNFYLNAARSLLYFLSILILTGVYFFSTYSLLVFPLKTKYPKLIYLLFLLPILAIFASVYPIIHLVMFSSIILVILSIIYIYFSSQNSHPKMKQILIMCLMTLILVVLINVPSFYGGIDAYRLINGDAGAFEVGLLAKNLSISNNTFILISQSNGNYYLIEKNSSKNKTPILYVIPEKEVNMITIKYKPESFDATLASKILNTLKIKL